jgi:hypothetical protein
MRMTGAENQRRVRARRKAKGLCNKCGKPPEEGRKMCRPCLDQACERQKEYHARRKDEPEYREWYRAKNRANAAKRRADPECRKRMWEKARKAARKRRDMLQEIKLSHGCADCGYKAHPEALDFDHRNPTEKRFWISKIKTLSLASLMAEVAKCDVVCANCHRIRTYNRRVGAT